MIKFNSVIVAILISFLLTFNAKASHMVGSDMTYSCTSTPGVYHVVLTLYRDCSGIPLGTCSGTCSSGCSYTLNWASVGCSSSYSGTFSCSLTSVSDVDRNMQCPNSKNICTNMGCVTAGSLTPGIEKYVFEGNVNLDTTVLPSSCCNVRIYWQECCRNSSIMTGAAGNNFYIESTINRCASANTPCNSSPVFGNEPFIQICSQQSLIFNAGGIDPDHDSLSYALTPALTASGTSVNYNSPYSYLAPMQYYPPINAPFPLGFKCDAITGDIMFTPAYSGGYPFVGIIAVTVYQWRKIGGVPTIVGTTRRDIQMWTTTCSPNTSPMIMTTAQGSTTPSNNLSYTAIRGIQLCFDVSVKDIDFYPTNTPPISDTTYLTWDNSLASLGATFTKNYVDSTRKINGPRQDSVKFCWTPPLTANPSLPYIISITGKDNHCPIPGRVQRAISITVCDTPVGITFKNTVDSCAKWKLSINTSNNTAIYSAQWDVSNTKGAFNASSFTSYFTAPATNVLFNDTGKFVARVTLNPGTTIQKITYDTINVIYKTMILTTSHFDTTICSGNRTVYKTNVQGGRTPYTISWKDSATSSIRSTIDSIALNNYSGKSKYYMTVTNYYGCSIRDSFRVQNSVSPTVSLPASTRVCKGTNTVFDAGINGGNIKKYLWSTGDTTRTITRNDSNQFVVTVTDTLGCKTSSTANLYINTVYPFAGNDTSVCGAKPITLHATGGQLYQWKNLNINAIISPKSTTSTGIVTQLSTTTYEATVYSTIGGLECSKADTVVVVFKNLPTSILPASARICNGSTYILDPGNNGGNIKKYLWNTGDTTHTITRTDSNLFIVTLTDTLGCQLTDTENLYVNTVHPFAGNDTFICGTKTITLHVIGGQNYQWKNLNTNTIIAAKSTSPNVAVTPTSTTTYEATVYSTIGGLECSKADTVVVVFKNAPISIFPASARICKGSTYTLDPGNNGGNIKKYLWNTGATTQTITRNDSNLFIVTLTDTSNCSLTDSMPLFVNKPIIAFAGNDTTICVSGTANLHATGGQNYQWKNLLTSTIISPKSTNANTSVSVSTTTPFEVVVYAIQSAIECSNKDTIIAIVNSKPATPVITGLSSVPRGQANSFNVTNNSGSSYNWFITNGNINSGNGTNTVSVVFTNIGTGSLKVFETASTNCKSDTALKTVIVNAGVGINAVTTNENFHIYPNPANTELNIELGDINDNANIELTDVLGQTVMQKTFHAKHNFNEKLDVSELARGVYFINIKVGNQTMQAKVLLK